MAYNIFSQPQGPNIDVNLFPSSASRGVDMGNALGTPLSNIIEGGLKGYKEGVAIRGELQQQEIRQNQIDQFPVQNERQRLALEQEKQNLAKDKTINSPEMLAQLQQEQQEYLALRDNPDRQAFADAVQAGRFEGLFAADPNLAKQAIQSTYALWSPANQDAYQQMTGRRDRVEALEREKLAAQKDADKNESAFRQNDFTNQVLAANPGASYYDILKEGKVTYGKALDNLTKESLAKLDPETRAAQEKAMLADVKPTYRFSFRGQEYEPPPGFITDLGSYRTSYDYLKNNFQGQGGNADLKAEASAVDAQRTAAAGAAEASLDEIPFASSVEKVDAPATMEDKVLEKRNAIRQKKGLPPLSAAPTPTPIAGSGGGGAGGGGEELSKVDYKKEGLPSFLANQPPIIRAVAEVESGFKPAARSKAGAVGYMQIMPGTFKDVVNRYSKIYPQYADQLKNMSIDNPQDNVKVGYIYLAEQLKKFGTRPGQGLELALSAYNAGPGTVSHALTIARTKSWDGVKEAMKTFLRPEAYKEASEYPDKVIKAWLKARKTNTA